MYLNKKSFFLKFKIVKIPGLHFDELSQKMVFTPAMYESVDVSCVAACESEKALISENLSKKVTDATVSVFKFCFQSFREEQNLVM